MSALVAFMSSFVIGYAIRFMLGRRKKEFATYELIGLSLIHISLMKTEDINGFSNLTIEPATIDEIVVFTSKKGDDYE